MKTEQEIKTKLEYEQKIVAQFKDCTEGTEGYERLKIAENLVSALSWVLEFK